MSGSAGSDGGSRIYGFPNSIGHDRHIQNIIDHTHALFSDNTRAFPRFYSSLDVTGDGVLQNQSGTEQEDDPDLDEFDRSLLGRPQNSSRPRDIESHNQGLLLPFANAPTQPRRVVGDASHHFRSFVPHDFNHQSPLLSTPSSFRGNEPSPASRHIFERHGSHRIGQLQTGAQMVTPPFYTAPNPTSSLGHSLSSSSPTHIGSSSPSARLSLRQNAKVAHSPLVTQKGAGNLKSHLEHTRDETPVVNDTRLIDPRRALPDKARTVFPYEIFNVVQSECFPLIYGTDDNVVVSAPTGCGKTAILEMAICRLAMSPSNENFKIVYQAPTKALCSERARDWDKKFSHMNLKCIELTGDTSQAQASRVGGASIIVTTPEKWDSITRKWSDHRKLLDMIRLVLIDEVHILKDIRGATLEVVVSRMKTIGANVRFVALSATVPNIIDVAKWLGRDHSNEQLPAHAKAFGEELRPVKLQRYVYGYKSNQNDFIFDKSLDDKLASLLAKHSQKKPIMIFCFTRKSCESTATKLAEWWSSCETEHRAWPAPTRRIPVISRELQEIVRYGVAFHHAGLDAQDRSAVAQNFLDGQIHVICCTSTLAVGVNLPCHTVVLKGTTGYSNNGPQEYSDLEVMQMLGRAGRPQFDDSAVAIIMTKTANVNRYKVMMSGKETLESTLHLNLVEHLNSEISLGTIQDVETAKKWIGGTFLSVRMRRSPSLYHLEDVRNAKDADKRMEVWCERDVKLLQKYELITEHAPFKCTEYGHAMSRYMVSFETMKLLLSIPRGAELEEILTTLCGAVEFKDFRFKPEERALFRELNKSPFILHPIKEALMQTWHKVFLMVQVHLGGVELPSEKGFGQLKHRIATEKTAIFDRLNRLVRCFIDCRAFDGDGLSTRAGLELARCLAANSWENKPSQLSQIPGFGPVTVRKWVSHGVHTVLELADREFDEIERISSRNPPYGMNLLKTLADFPRLDMKTQLITATARRLQAEETVTVTLKVNLRYCNAKIPPIWNRKVPAVTFVVLTTNGNIAYLWRGNLRKIDKSTGLNLSFPVALAGSDQKISCYFSCEEIVGTEVVKVLEPDIPKTAFKHKKVQPTRHETWPTTSLGDNDDIGDGDLLDEDMLNAALTTATQNDDIELLEDLGGLDGIKDDFPLIDEVLPQDTKPSASGPIKMDNGKWMCNHRCRNGGLTTTGKLCTHKCCHEGLDKPRPPPGEKKTKAKNIGENARSEEGSSANETSTKQPRPSGATTSVKANQAKGTMATNSTHKLAGSSTTLPNMKRKRLVQDDENEVTFTKKRSKVVGEASDLDLSSDIECIDLCTVSANDGFDRSSSAVSTTSDKKDSPRPHQRLPGNMTNSITTAKDTRSQATLDPFERSRAAAASSYEDGGTQYGSDIFADDEFPDLESLVRLNELNDASKSQMTLKDDQTLYPGVVQTLKESMDFG
ncbi:P-loop containing nucleoside triphosphate hydrolase protein [Hypoxylon sp. FL0543]|nr:P-loop containing nucleoside triphosphate hydrolase protein [Hypoxylon sp. FL0543]